MDVAEGGGDLTEGRCTVWWAAAVPPRTAPQLVELLDGAERSRLGHLRREDDRARYLAGHALVRCVLARILDRPAGSLRLDRRCRCGADHGRPSVLGGPAFSLTHAGRLVGVAVHTDPVGLDVEPVRVLGDLSAMVRYACSPRESVADDRDFLRLWTRKEALLKATGHGLASPMADITIGERGVLDWTGAGAPSARVWVQDLVPGPDHVAAVAGLGELPRVHEADGDALLSARR